jgi:hypothetical protein
MTARVLQPRLQRKVLARRRRAETGVGRGLTRHVPCRNRRRELVQGSVARMRGQAGHGRQLQQVQRVRLGAAAQGWLKEL